MGSTDGAAESVGVTDSNPDGLVEGLLVEGVWLGAMEGLNENERASVGDSDGVDEGAIDGLLVVGHRSMAFVRVDY